MKKRMWIGILGSVLILCGGIGAGITIRLEIPKQLNGSPLLAIGEVKKTLKDVIFETQKLVVMIETDTGSQGSGFLYNKQGDLITNAHVVSGVRNVRVKTSDARELSGEVIGISTNVDLAVVRVKELAGIEPLPLVRYENGEVGDDVMAVGSPLGFQNTVTTGIISGVGRSFQIDQYTYNDLYQISAHIAPGNSGGPLVDMKTGAVLGINSAGLEENAIGFSIPISKVLPLAEGWSKEPMTMLPDLSLTDELGEESDEKSKLQQDGSSIDKLASYLVTHFYDSLNNRDYVYAYSLLGGNWKEGTSYVKFREGYLTTRNVVIDDMHVTSKDEEAVVTAVISVDERKDGENVLSKYQVTYKVAYENDQIKLISGKGKAISK
ncbi:trypsin-like peptidase domain-containing protein [Paenibacillus sp. GSMTC-2017]|uniref:S1C family serine protease n=1 Tax=Paenibacillus sp. GSMTC-2017 TaxID=2794350 RepID=UPI0018D94797|nr:trypsin-like peptidase domain-containing protein [Paenibacillus sp. GSMTC-2017]MBH5318931.1 trypsin-like peptidase domain-containing protein [Paenibacillus sp. GSMTC-2017]